MLSYNNLGLQGKKVVWGRKWGEERVGRARKRKKCGIAREGPEVQDVGKERTPS